MLVLLPTERDGGIGADVLGEEVVVFSFENLRTKNVFTDRLRSLQFGIAFAQDINYRQ